MTDLPDVWAYRRSYDHTLDAWHKRSDANDFAVFLAAELKINAKGVTVEKDGKFYRVYVPLASAYWMPSSGPEGWTEQYKRIRREIRLALQA